MGRQPTFRSRAKVRYNLTLLEQKINSLTRKTSLGIIYALYCTATDQTYIGLTAHRGCNPGKHLEVKRFYYHIHALRRGNHPCSEIQRDFDKHGEEAFEVDAIEVMEMQPVYVQYSDGDRRILIDPEWMLFQREAWWIENLPNLYNRGHRNHARYWGGYE